MYKTNDKTNASNVLSILSSFTKHFKKVIKTRLVNFWNKHNYYGKLQFGFREGKLLKYMSRVYTTINDGQFTAGVVYWYYEGVWYSWLQIAF